MKKFSIFFLLTSIMLLLCSCGTSKEAKTVIDQIDAIGIVTLDSGELIESAEESYSMLCEDDVAQVDNYEKLVNARTEYDNLVKAEQIKQEAAKIDLEIEKIGTISLSTSCKNKITSAERAYTNADDAVKNAVTKKKILDEAKQTYSELQDKADAEEAAKIDDLINGIGQVSIDKASEIENARKTYQDASGSVRNKVTKLQELNDAEKELISQKEDEAKRILSENFTKEYDQVQDMTFYLPSAMPDYIDTRCYVIPYIGMAKGSTWIVIRWNYTGEDWVFYDKVTIVAGTHRYSCNFDYWEINRDNSGGVVWETYDQLNVGTTDMKMLEAMTTSEEVIVRFEGKHNVYDLTLSQSDKEAIRNVLTVYDYLDS